MTITSTDTIGPDNLRTVADLAQRAAGSETLDAPGQRLLTDRAGRPYVVTHSDEALLDEPGRKRGVARFRSASDFVQYVIDHGEDHRTSLWASLANRTVIAVLNGHEKATLAGNGHAGWGDHRAMLTLPEGPEWAAWVARDGKLSSQAEFSDFIEDHVADIVEPAAATMLEIARRFDATKGLEFTSGQSPESGEIRLAYIETIAARAGSRGDLAIPETMQLGLAPFDGGDLYRVEARFRYRITDGKLQLGYRLTRPDLVLRTAFDEIVAAIAGAGEPVFDGIPADAVQAAPPAQITTVV